MPSQSKRAFTASQSRPLRASSYGKCWKRSTQRPLIKSAKRHGSLPISRLRWSSAKSGAWRACLRRRENQRQARESALWADGWLRRLAEKYSRPIVELARLYTPTELAYEIAALIAEAVITQAQRLVELPADKDARAALGRERMRVKNSSDWLDRLISERMAQDAETKKVP
jgi:hypothetical protein